LLQEVGEDDRGRGYLDWWTPSFAPNGAWGCFFSDYDPAPWWCLVVLTHLARQCKGWSAGDTLPLARNDEEAALLVPRALSEVEAVRTGMKALVEGRLGSPRPSSKAARRTSLAMSARVATRCSGSTAKDLFVALRAVFLADIMRSGGIIRPQWYGESLSLVSTTHLVQVCGSLPSRVDHGITKVAVVHAKVKSTFGEGADNLPQGARVVVLTFAQGVAAVGYKDRVVVGVPG
jgi:hypothetical protein